MTRLTSRDLRILRSSAAGQVLTTSQIERWHFEGVGIRRVQRRLKQLVDAQYLQVVPTKIGADNLYTLGKAGAEQLQKAGWDAELKKELPKDLDHHLGVTDIRIAIECGLEKLPTMRLCYFYAYWELGQFQWPYPIIPDAVFSIRNAYTAQAAVEFDRGLYALTVFAKKLFQYRLLLRAHPISTVILVAEKRANVERLDKGLEEVRTQIPLLTVALDDLREKGLCAVPRPREHMYGTRTIAEQMEIDAMRNADPDI